MYLLGHRLHTYVLWWTAPRAVITQDSGTLRRVVLHCPGEETCRRGGGCDTTLDDELAAAIRARCHRCGSGGIDRRERRLGRGRLSCIFVKTINDYQKRSYPVATQPLLAAGWEEISSSSSELGDVEVFCWPAKTRC